MENELAILSLNDEEDEIMQIHKDPLAVRKEEFQLVGCFLTASLIHFPAMKSTVANLWHLVRGGQIRELGEKEYLFQFFHIMDLESVLKGSPWTFNNHLLILPHLQKGEDSLIVPLIYALFWIQIHDVLTRLFFENLAVQLGNFLRDFLKYDGSGIGKENRNYMRVRAKLDIKRLLKRKKQVMFNGRYSYVMFKYERLSFFCFYCGRLGHSDSFCDAKMLLGVEVAELG